jgi:hypothetical protein
MVEVVNLKTCKDWGQPGDIRIDRATKYGNPFFMSVESRRDEVCDNYQRFFELQEAVAVNKITVRQAEEALIHMGLHVATAIILIRDFRFDISELKDAKRLGCWCAPKRCHGDYLKKRIEAL